MKDKLDIIFSRDEKDIEHISERYPAAGKNEKKKIYEISRKKYDELRAGDSDQVDDGYIKQAEGVERYNRPSWYRGLCAAAAAVILMGGVSGGVILSRSSRTPHMDQSGNSNTAATSVEGSTEALIFEDDAVVDKLLSNVEIIQKPQYPTIECVDLNDVIYFNKDEYSEVADDFVNLTKYYYAVTDERLDTMEEVEAMVRDTFIIYESGSSYLGRDLSSHEVGYDFKDDSMANKYVRTYITYNGKVYVQSQCEPNSSLSDGFEGLYNFSGYKLMSSDFSNGGEFLYMNSNIYGEDSEPVSLEKLVTCKRVYERSDGQKVTVNIQLLPDNDVWKIASFDVKQQGEAKGIENSESKQPTSEVSDAGGEFGELQLHENIIYSSFDEALAAYEEMVNQRSNGAYKFKKVDVEKYSDRILKASDNDELNTLENKSYIFHLMLNSSRYFDTAELTYTYNGHDDKESWSKTEHCLADNRDRYIYVDYTFDEGTDHDNRTICMYDGTWINADNNSKTYFVSEDDASFSMNMYIPDNLRYFCHYDEGAINLYAAETDVVFGQLGMDCLYPTTNYMQEYRSMNDFDTWRIDRTEELLGRQCAVIKIDYEYYIAEKHVDLKTGIVLKSADNQVEYNKISEINVTSIEIDKPLDYIYFDRTGYTDTTEYDKTT